MKPRSSTGRALAPLVGATALLTLAGCATPGGSSEPTTDAAPTGRTWHDPRFYDPWFDPEAVVLPPPPFTGFAPDGKIPPVLPTRERPAAGP